MKEYKEHTETKLPEGETRKVWGKSPQILDQVQACTSLTCVMLWMQMSLTRQTTSWTTCKLSCR